MATAIKTKKQPEESYMLFLRGYPGHWQIYGDGFSGDEQETRAKAFISWLTTLKCRRNRTANNSKIGDTK